MVQRDISEFANEDEYAAQMATGALLNPRVDSTFKALFTQPNDDSRGALQSFLEAATERKIASWELRPNEAPVGFSGQRGVSYDIACEFANGLSADIEMQAFDQLYDYGKRAEYQVARLETTYLKKGDNWEQAPTVYQITVLDFNYVPKDDGRKTPATDIAATPTPVSRYAMRTKDGRELANALNIIFIELPKALMLESQLETNSPLENWAIFLKDADNPQKQDVIDRLAQKEAGLMQAQKSLSNISANRDLWIAQYRQEVRDRDRRSGLSAALAEGRTLGIAEGRTLGIAEGKLALAKKFMLLGHSAKEAAAFAEIDISLLK